MNSNHEPYNITIQTIGYVAIGTIVLVLLLLFLPLALFFIPLILILLALRDMEKDLAVSYPKKKLHV